MKTIYVGKQLKELGERELLEVIDERDRAEEAINQLCGLIGFRPEWSNLYGYREAIAEAKQRLAHRRKKSAV